MGDWTDYLSEHRTRFMDEMADLLRIPSISTDSAHREDVRRAADWTADRLRAAGIEGVAVRETGGHPIVYGEWLHAPGKPTALIYGHFDVQPVDPVEAWTSPPFEPVERDGRLYARGASDMKGNLLLPVFACEALLKTGGALPINVKFIFEGEEEIGSPNLAGFIDSHRDLLACDLVINADSLQYAEDQPGVLVGTRGICAVQIDVHGTPTDLHSGLLGGIAPNPIHGLVSLLSTMVRPDGSIGVEGFYDDVIPISDEDRQSMSAIPDDTEDIKRQSGIVREFGEPGFTPRERNWARPTLEVNGIWGGYQGEGVKTIIPREAHAKISCRLVANQEPHRILEVLRAHISKYAPPELEVSVVSDRGMADPYLVPPGERGTAAAERALQSVYGKPAYRIRMGATVPANMIFRKLLGVYTTSFGFSLPDEHQHGADEFVRLSNLDKGQQAFVRLMEELGG